MDLELGGALDAGRLRWAQTMAHAHGTNHPLHVRLAGLKDFSPGGVVALLTLIDSVRRSGHEVRVDRATRASVNLRLAGFGLGDVLDELRVRHDLPDKRPGAGEFGVTRFEGASSLQAAAERAFEWEECDSVEQGSQLFIAVAEIGQNVLDHTGLDYGFIAADRTSGEVRYAVGDSGRGFLESLALRGATSDREAVTMAVEQGVSSTAQPGRGCGLAELARHAVEGGGRTVVISGSANLQIASNADRASRAVLTTVPAAGGAVVGGVISRHGGQSPSHRSVA